MNQYSAYMMKSTLLKVFVEAIWSITDILNMCKKEFDAKEISLI